MNQIPVVSARTFDKPVVETVTEFVVKFKGSQVREALVAKFGAKIKGCKIPANAVIEAVEDGDEKWIQVVWQEAVKPCKKVRSKK